MRKFIKNIFAFSLFTVIFYVITLCVWTFTMPLYLKPNVNYRIGTYGHMFSRISEVKNVHNIDILIVGSSHAYRGFDTRIFEKNNLSAFNLGSSSQTPIQSQLLLRRYVNQLKPKVIIYEVNPSSFSIDGVESSIDIIANDDNDFYSFMMTFDINNIKTYNTFIYGVICDVLEINNTISEPKTKKEDTYISGGYVEREMAYFTPTEMDSLEVVFNPKQLKAFSQTISDMRAMGIDVLLAFAPITKVDYNRYGNMSFFDFTMYEYGHYINFNNTLNLDDSLHFYDSEHLNQDGVELFNLQVIKELNTNQ